MSTHVPGFQLLFFSDFSHYFVMVKLATSCIRANTDRAAWALCGIRSDAIDMKFY